MKLKIVTPDRLVLEEEVDAFYGKTVDGMFGVLPHHVPLVAPLEVGVMSYVKNGQKHPLAVMGGLLRTDGKTVTVLSDAAEIGASIDTVRAQKAKERAEAELPKLVDKIEVATTRLALSRAQVRLKAAGKNA